MIGFLVGFASLAGLIYTVRAGHRGGMGGFGPRRFVLHRLFSHLETTPGQEKEVRDAMNDFLRTLEDQKGAVHRSREQVAEAVRGDTLDAEVLGAAFATQDDALRALRDSGVEALGRVHAVLDDEQRRRLARLIVDGPGFGFADHLRGGGRRHRGHGCGPYREAC